MKNAVPNHVAEFVVKAL